jgi:hypothetical protein
MAVFQFHLQSQKRGKVGRVGYVSRAVFGQKFPGEKGSEKGRIVVIAISFVTKARNEVFAHFHAVAVKRYSSMWN